jgi:plasmid maintenance system antidote protein VapI
MTSTTRRTRAAKELAAWLATDGRSQGALSRAVQIDPSHLCRILSGRARPSLALALRLEQQSGVPVAMWAAE